MLLGVDLGTSAIKVSLLDPETGREVASASSPGELPRFAPHPNWCEQNPQDWWDGFLAALIQLPGQLRAQVKAIGISYQMHGLVLVDTAGEPVRNSIIWADGRAIESGLHLESSSDSNRVLNHPGNFTMAKLRWVRDHEPEAFARAAKAMLPGDYLAYRLTGHAATTSTGLSEMIAWDFVRREPATEVWDAAGHRALMPEVVPIFGDQGRLSAPAAEATGLPVGMAVTYRAGDQPNNALSLNVFNPGELAAVAGTSGVLYGVTDHPTRDSEERVNTFLHVNDTPENPRLGVLLCVNGAGGFYSWVRKALGAANFDVLDDLAAHSSAGANGVIAIPYGNGPERSLGNKNPGAGLQNLDVNRHTREDIARAAMEGVVFALRYGADVLKSMGLDTRVVRAGEGSMFQSELFQKIFASALKADLQILDTDGALGAARAAGVGAGIYRDLSQAFASVRVVREVSPEASLSAAYDGAYSDWKALALR